MAKKTSKTNPIQDTEETISAEATAQLDEFLGDSVHEKRERPKGKTVVTGAAFHDFSKEPVFVGKYLRDVIRESDGPNVAKNPNEKKGTVMGFLFASETGEEEIIGASFAINKALEDKKLKEETLWIEFLGKSIVKGKPFNRFHIQTVD